MALQSKKKKQTNCILPHRRMMVVAVAPAVAQVAFSTVLYLERWHFEGWASPPLSTPQNRPEPCRLVACKLRIPCLFIEFCPFDGCLQPDYYVAHTAENTYSTGQREALSAANVNDHIGGSS